MLYELMTKYNSADVIPPLSNRDNGLVKSWLKPLGSYGGVVHSNIQAKTYETLSEYLDAFFKIIEMHTRFAQRAKQLQLAFMQRDTVAIEARAEKPLRDTHVTSRGRKGLHNLNEHQYDVDSSLFMDEIDAVMAYYDDAYEENDSEGSVDELDRRMAELNYVADQRSKPNSVPHNGNQVKFDKLMRRPDARIGRDSSDTPNRSADIKYKKKPCYVHLLLKSKGNQSGCTKPDCPYSHTDEAMEELWSEVSNSMKQSPFKPKGINNLNSIEDQEL